MHKILGIVASVAIFAGQAQAFEARCGNQPEDIVGTQCWQEGATDAGSVDSDAPSEPSGEDPTDGSSEPTDTSGAETDNAL